MRDVPYEVTLRVTREDETSYAVNLRDQGGGRIASLVTTDPNRALDYVNAWADLVFQGEVWSGQNAIAD